MNSKLALLTLVFGFGCSFYPTTSQAISESAKAPASAEIPLSEIEEKLAGPGLEVWIHGSVPQHSLFVVSYRRPDNFFVFIDLSIYGASDEAKQMLAGSKRHDRVRVWGELNNSKTSQPHIAAERILLEERFTGLDPYPPYDREVSIPNDLKDKSEFIGKVHALFNGGEILVVEYKDAVLPVFVPAKSRNWTAGLNRGDKIRLHFEVQKGPRKPTHLNLNTQVAKPLEVLFSSRSQHGQLQTREGSLVMFPKSPQIQFNVFALQQDIGDGVMLEYTLVNFEDAELFRALRAKLQTVWDQEAKSLKNGRNKLLNLRIQVKATGKINVVDSNQANPQVLINNLDDLSFRVLP